MQVDLNIPYSKEDLKNPDRLHLIIARFSEIGESTIALNYTIENYSSSTCDLLSISPFENIRNLKHPVIQLTRVTVETDDIDIDISKLRSKYQLVAIRTSNEAVFEQACTAWDIDIISLDCSKRMPFRLKRETVQMAIRRGIVFEICYAAGIRDNSLRAYVLQNSKEIVACTNGSNLIFSSGAEHVSEIRNASSIYFFAKSLGLPNDKATFVTGKVGETLVHKLSLKQQ